MMAQRARLAPFIGGGSASGLGGALGGSSLRKVRAAVQDCQALVTNRQEASLRTQRRALLAWVVASAPLACAAAIVPSATSNVEWMVRLQRRRVPTVSRRHVFLCGSTGLEVSSGSACWTLALQAGAVCALGERWARLGGGWRNLVSAFWTQPGAERSAVEMIAGPTGSLVAVLCNCGSRFLNFFGCRPH